MGLLSFRGGIHPYDGKDLSKEKPIKKVLPKGDVVYLMSQHIGAPAKPVVAVNDHVLVGQKIAEAGGFISAPVHSSVSGTVKKIEKRMGVTGDFFDAIIVENDHTYETVQYQPLADLKTADHDTIIERIREGGVVGMGGAGFPTYVKMSPKEPDKVDTIIVNGAECEPYLTSDYRRMLEEPELVVGGLRAILQLFPTARGFIAIENNKPDCIAKMQDLVRKEERMQVATLKTKYPQGAERALIYAVTKRQINSSMLPADVGCIVDNIDTVVAIYKAVMLGQPLMHRIVTVTGDAIKEPCNFYVPTGTDYAELIDEAGGFQVQPQKIVSGGPMMGFGMYSLHVPVTKTSSALLCLSEDMVSQSEESACINCGKCVAACPGHILPARVATFANHDEEENFLKFDGMECCECGCCSFICPAKRPLTQSIKSYRRAILAKRKKKG